jgi:hypothetical protein
MMHVIVMEIPPNANLADALLSIADAAHRAAIIPTASRRLIRPECNFVQSILINMSVVEPQQFV